MTAYVLNLIDLAFTLHALGHGAVELNPLMRSVSVLLGWKVGVAGLLCCCLEILAIKYQVAKWGLRICTAVFAVINIWHIINIAAAAAH